MAGDVVTRLVDCVIACNTTGLGLVDQQEINFSRVSRGRLIHAVIMTRATRAAALMAGATIYRGRGEVDMGHMRSLQVGLIISLWRLAVRRHVMAGGAIGDRQRVASSVTILTGGISAASARRLGMTAKTVRVVGNCRPHMASRQPILTDIMESTGTVGMTVRGDPVGIGVIGGETTGGSGKGPWGVVPRRRIGRQVMADVAGGCQVAC